VINTERFYEGSFAIQTTRIYVQNDVVSEIAGCMSWLVCWTVQGAESVLRQVRRGSRRPWNCMVSVGHLLPYNYPSFIAHRLLAAPSDFRTTQQNCSILTYRASSTDTTTLQSLPFT